MNSSLDTALWAIVPAAGKGERIGAETPKQYLPLAGRSILEHTLSQLLTVPSLAGVVTVLADDDRHWQNLPQAADSRIRTCTGGKHRSDSVANGLRRLLDDAPTDSWVLVHDAARPLIAHSDIQRLINAVYNSGAVGGLLAQPVQDTLKQADDYFMVEATRSRENLWQAQTPQLFRAGQLLEALTSATAAITDEASAMEQSGHAPLLVEALQANFKITRPSDLPLAEVLLRQRTPV